MTPRETEEAAGGRDGVEQGGHRGPTKQQSAHAQWQQHQLRQQQDKSGSRESSKEKEVAGEDDGEVGKKSFTCDRDSAWRDDY